MAAETEPEAKAAAKAVVFMRGGLRGYKAGQRRELPKEQAEYLVTNKHADWQSKRA